MKIYIILIFCSFILFSCSNETNQKLSKLNNEIERIKSENEKMNKKLDSIDDKFLNPFYSFQKTISIEKEISPDSIIQRYENLINLYPDSYWSHEAKKRKEKIDKRRKYWKNGKWDLPAKSNIQLPMNPISCPGC